VAPAAVVAEEIRLGGEFQVNQYTTGRQSDTSVAVDADGDFVIAWQHVWDEDEEESDVFARRFSSAGAVLASEFLVNSYTSALQAHPNVAAAPSGNFVVAWSSFNQDGLSFGVFARRFTSAGAAMASEFQINTHTQGSEAYPSLTFLPSGDFVVAWGSVGQDGDNYGIFARRFTSVGAPLASELQVNAYTTGSQRYASIARAASGGFVVAWQSNGQDGSLFGVFARRFSSAGTALASEFQVNTHTPDSQTRPAVAGGGAGDFVIAWGSRFQDGDGYGVFARHFSSAGAPLASEFQVSTRTSGYQSLPAVAGVAGDFVITWQATGQDGSSSGVFARRFSNTGAALASEFQVNTHTSSFQAEPSVAAAAAGDFVVIWRSHLQDGSDYGVFAQRFAGQNALDIDGDGLVGALTDGLLMLRFLFGFTGATLTSGAINTSGCTRCTAQDIEPFLLAGGMQPGDGAARRLGAELQVNAYTPGGQSTPAVAAASDGDFVVAWRSTGQDGSSFGVFTRRFSSAGVALGVEIQTNAYTADDQFDPAVAADADGDFVVAWLSEGQDGSNYGGVFARRFSSAGAALASEFQVNSYTSGLQDSPAVAADSDGDFVIAWRSNLQDGDDFGVFARRFSSDGAALASEFQVSTYTINPQFGPSVAVRGAGDFVIAWSSFGQDGSVAGVFARRFSSAGEGLANEFRVNTYTTGTQNNSSVAVDSDGDFVVTWLSNGQDGSGLGVFARRFSSAGAALASEFRVNTYTSGAQGYPSVAAGAGGDFVVSWRSNLQDSSDYGVFARRFSSVGAAVANEFQVTVYTTGSQTAPAVTARAAGDFVIAWQSTGQDGSNEGIFAQRFAVPRLYDIDGDGTMSPLTDGLLILRFLFGFTGTTLTSGAVNANGCSRCDASTIETYLQTLI
jgi:hypothetical protein